MADESERQPTSIPPVWLDPADIHILRFLRERGPTYHINVSKELPHDIQYVSRRCKYLASHDLLDRKSRTYYGLTDRGEGFIKDVPEDGFDKQTIGSSG